MINLRKALGEDSAVFEILEALVKAAIFDPAEEVRKTAINSIEKRYDGSVKEGFVTEGKVFVEIGENARVGYVCDAPKIYIGKPSCPHDFTIPGYESKKEKSTPAGDSLGFYFKGLPISGLN